MHNTNILQTSSTLGNVLSMPAELKSLRIQLVMSPSEVKAIDDWRRRQPALPSRGEAMRALIRKQLETEDQAAEKQPAA